MNVLAYIKSWCSTKESFSFFLPSGAEGRPFDSYFELIDIIEHKDSIIIKLDNSVEFSINGSFYLKDDIYNLIFSGFENLTYKLNGHVIKEFKKGEFCLSGY